MMKLYAIFDANLKKAYGQWAWAHSPPGQLMWSIKRTEPAGVGSRHVLWNELSWPWISLQTEMRFSYRVRSQHKIEKRTCISTHPHPTGQLLERPIHFVLLWPPCLKRPLCDVCQPKLPPCIMVQIECSWRSVNNMTYSRTLGGLVLPVPNPAIYATSPCFVYQFTSCRDSLKLSV